MKASINAFKGYNFQGTIYCYFLCLMDLERKITELDAERTVENNFDDIYVKSDSGSFFVQVKNYKDISFEDIYISNKEIKISGYKPVKIGKKGFENNVIILRNLVIPKEKLNCSIFGLNCYREKNCYIVGYEEYDIKKIIEEKYLDQKRYNDILTLADYRINSGNFKFVIEDLPKIYLFEQKLQEKTAKIRHFVLNDDNNILFIVGKPGVGKSHLVNELITEKQTTNILVERLWISENDKDKNNRLKYDNFISDISKQLFNKSYIEIEESIIEELKRTNTTLVVDGLDHVENYNYEELNKYLNFFEKFKDQKLLVFTRPLKTSIKYQFVLLENWTEHETLDYLEFMKIVQYEVQLEIYKISKGYPIITSFLAKHYLLYKKIPKINEIESLNDFYDSLIKEGVVGLSIFLINNSYFKINELKELLTNFEFEIINEIIKRYPYLFSIKYDRIYLIHDSLNLYLREKNPNYMDLNDRVLKKILSELIAGNFRYLSRLDSFYIKEDDKVRIVKKYCNFDFINKILLETIDYEIVYDIVSDFGNIIFKNFYSFDLNKIYDYILLGECVNRNHHDGFYSLIIERLKYYLNNQIISFKDIYSTGILYYAFSCFIEKSYDPIAMCYSSRFDDYNREINEFSDVLKKSSSYFKIFHEKLNVEKYLEKNIKNIDISDKNILVYLICYLYIHKLKYKEYEQVAIAIIEEKNESKAERLFIKICREYKIRDFMARWGIKEIKDYLFSLGIDNGDNYYKNKSLKELITKYSGCGSFELDDYICNYVRLAVYENRTIDIESVGSYYYMYYSHKDYSLYKLPLALLIFCRKKYINLEDCINYIYEAMGMSGKGIRTIMTDFYNMLNEEEFEIAKKYWNDRIIVSNLEIDKINSLDDDIIGKYLEQKVMGYHFTTMNIQSKDIRNLLRSKYSKKIVLILDYYGFKIDDKPICKFDYKLLEDDKRIEEKFEKRDYLLKNDMENIKKSKISCVELAKYTDGWHNTLPYVELYKIYNLKEIQNKVSKIMYNVCFGYKKFNMYANRYNLVGNYLWFMELYSINCINWDDLYDSFIKFLEFSLIKK